MAESSPSSHDEATSRTTQTFAIPSNITVTVVSKTNSLFSSFNQVNSVKLDRGNYLLWESIVLLIVEGNKLYHHLDGSVTSPPRLILDGAEMKPNPDYTDWHATDRLLVGWLHNTMSVEIGAQLLHCQTAKAIWFEARSLAGASTKARVMVYKSDLHRTRKGGMSMSDFLNKMKSIADQLTLAGSPVPHEDLVLHTLNGLDAEYNAIVVKLLDQTHLSWVDIQAHLLAFENRIEQLNQFANLSLEPTAQLATRGAPPRPNSSSWSDSDGSHGGWRGSNQGFSGRNYRGRGGGRSARGRGNRGGGRRPFCHYCKRSSHDISKCYSLTDDSG
ncbi:hypothetical protein QN277_005589 [Acacia crassicarpa]|uniref:Retrotransposon Copia-like N-terminal domain-containing protein n=1 Tax=Acacia crassicarpa TaxID=499986 RepID=A0AAE1MBR2_9FABA|nr:hypothetical protein QN277_005589 [Acacia crassicarpa]